MRETKEKTARLINDVYIPLFTSTQRICRLQGGSGSGKSIAVAQYLLDITRDWKEKHRIVVLRKVDATSKDSTFKTFTDLISDYDFDHEFKITQSPLFIQHKITGNEILFKGLDKREKIKSIKDPTIIWMEEATEFNRQDFIQLNLRLRKEGVLNQLIISYNPIGKSNWIYKMFVEGSAYKGEELYIQSTYKDNYFLPQIYQDELENLALSDGNYHKIYALGEWGEDVRGLIYPNYTIVDHVPGSASTIIYGLDFGYNDPMALVKLHIEDSKDLYIDETYFKREATVQDLIFELPELEVKKNDIIYADSANPGKIQQIRNKGYRGIKKARKGQGSISSGIERVKDFNLFVTGRSTNVIKELDRYKWAEDKDGELIEAKPIDAFNHSLDGIRYGVYTHFYRKRGIRIA